MKLLSPIKVIDKLSTYHIYYNISLQESKVSFVGRWLAAAVFLGTRVLAYGENSSPSRW